MKRFGGVKVREIERDCLLAHGAAANLYEQLFMLSDFSQMHVCQICERVANVMRCVLEVKRYVAHIVASASLLRT
jgi:DNA-directed RNA polymerase IV and V subunit 2